MDDWNIEILFLPQVMSDFVAVTETMVRFKAGKCDSVILDQSFQIPQSFGLPWYNFILVVLEQPLIRCFAIKSIPQMGRDT